MSTKKTSNPTVVPANPFDPCGDAAALRKAMKGFGTDEHTIIQVLTRRSNEQRLRIAEEFMKKYCKDLKTNLKSETSGKFQDILVALMTPLPQFLAKELHRAIAGIGTDEDALIEILCTTPNSQLQAIKDAYNDMYSSSLEKDIRGDTSGSFKKLMTALCSGMRAEDTGVDEEMAKKDAKSLLQAVKGCSGVDKSTFIQILCSRSFPQLAATFKEYHNLSGSCIMDTIESKFTGVLEGALNESTDPDNGINDMVKGIIGIIHYTSDIKKGLLEIVQIANNRPLFFAKRLHKSMRGLGTNDRQLIRVMVTRCELDLADIANMFQSKYGGTLQSWIVNDCSGNYKKCLLKLLSPMF